MIKKRGKIIFPVNSVQGITCLRLVEVSSFMMFMLLLLIDF